MKGTYILFLALNQTSSPRGRLRGVTQLECYSYQLAGYVLISFFYSSCTAITSIARTFSSLRNVAITGYALCTYIRVLRITLLGRLFVITPLASLIPHFVIQIFDCGRVGHDRRRRGSNKPRSRLVIFKSNKFQVFQAFQVQTLQNGFWSSIDIVDRR